MPKSRGRTKSTRSARGSGDPRLRARAGAGRYTARQLVEGVRGPGQVRIHMARPEQAQKAVSLLETAGREVTLEPGIIQALVEGSLSSLVLEAVTHGPDAMNRPLVEGFHPDGGREMTEVFAGLITILVAEHPEHGVIGALEALPPAKLLTSMGLSPIEELAGMSKIVKLRAVAVEESHRHHGVAAALIRTCRRLYQQAGYLMMYGQFDVDRKLGDFYTKLGFEVLPVGAGVPVPIFSRPIGIRSEGEEQMFSTSLV